MEQIYMLNQTISFLNVILSKAPQHPGDEI
jgi:hypothetical protein